MIEKGFGVVSLQSAFFIGSLEVKNKLELAKNLIDSTARIFDGDPVLLPIPGKLEDFPAEIPFIFLKNNDSSFSCNIARNRIDFFYKGKQETKKNLSELWPDYEAIVIDIAKFIKDSVKERIWRLGFVVALSREFKKSINALLMKNYLKAGVFEEPYEIQLNILNKITYEEVELNRWIKIRPIREEEDQSKDFGFSIELDMNTISERTYSFEIDQVARFFNYCHSHIKNEIPRYILIEG